MDREGGVSSEVLREESNNRERAIAGSDFGRRRCRDSKEAGAVRGGINRTSTGLGCEEEEGRFATRPLHRLGIGSSSRIFLDEEQSRDIRRRELAMRARGRRPWGGCRRYARLQNDCSAGANDAGAGWDQCRNWRRARKKGCAASSIGTWTLFLIWELWGGPGKRSR
jgi:hypothetical protein